MGAQRSNLPPNFPKMEDYQRQNGPKSAKVAQKLRSPTLQFSGGTNNMRTAPHKAKLCSLMQVKQKQHDEDQ